MTTYTLHAVGGTLSADLQASFSVGQLSVSPNQWSPRLAAGTPPNADLARTYVPEDDPLLTIQGGGYQPGEWVDISITRLNNLDCCGSTPFPAFRLQVGADGAFTVARQVDPRLTSSGTHVVRALGATSGVDSSTRVYVTAFDFREAIYPFYAKRQIPANTPTQITLRGFGFQAGELVTLSGGSAILGTANSVTASSVGDWQIAATVSAAPGVYTLVARGETSKFTSRPNSLYVGTAAVNPLQLRTAPKS